MNKQSYAHLLKNTGFQAYLWTQFLGILNDNIFKFVLTFYVYFYATQLAQDGNAEDLVSLYVPLIGAIFIIPFIMFSGWAGYIADTFNKRNVLIITKSMEIISMALAIAAFHYDWLNGMFLVLFLMATQSTLFSPAKYGIIPEMFSEKELSRANGLLEMSTFLAIILGTIIAGPLFTAYSDNLVFIGVILLIMAVIGFITSLGITSVPNDEPQSKWSLNPFQEIGLGFKSLFPNKPLLLTVIGISYFWFLGALYQMDLVFVGKEILGQSDTMISFLFTFLALGIGIGSIVAGSISGEQIKLGLVPFGAAGIAIFSMCFLVSALNYYTLAFNLLCLGFTAGFFSVPLYAFLQHRGGANEKGRLFATCNFLNTVGILLASPILYFSRTLFNMESHELLFAFGVVSFVGLLSAFWFAPDIMWRKTLYALVKVIYNIKVYGRENIPQKGPYLIIANHVSHMDGQLIGVCTPHIVRFMIWAKCFDNPLFRVLFKIIKAIPVKHTTKGIAYALKEARGRLQAGEVVCIFPEGGLTRNGNMMPFRRGFEIITKDIQVPIVPVYIDGMWESAFSFNHDIKKWKRWITEFRRPINITFGEPLHSEITRTEAALALRELSAKAIGDRPSVNKLLPVQFIKSAKKRMGKLCMADSTGKELTYAKTLIGCMVLRKWVKHNHANEEMIGLLLPNTVGGALCNIGLMMAGKVPVNLNYTSGREAMDSCIERCNIKTIISSKIFLKKAGLEPRDEMVYIEDVLKSITKSDRLKAALMAYALPSFILSRVLKPKKQTADDIATIIFSSGSTGMPKGAMVTHKNILTNVQGTKQVFHVTSDDCMMGVLPFFHAFGFMGTIWFPLLNGFKIIYHPNPMDAKTIGEMCEQYQTTLLISTPTFYKSYIRKCTKEQFAHLRICVVGAEKLRDKIYQDFFEKFGVELLEGYGCTETGPVVSVNVPNKEDKHVSLKGHQPGSIGQPIPGVAVKIVNIDTYEDLSLGEEGMLLVKSPGCMKGYYKQPDKTDDAFQDGWYITGDIAKIDGDGFITITDRLSRFSKIGGEMVPHGKIESIIHDSFEDIDCAVTSVPDDSKGERLILLYTDQDKTPGSIWKLLSETELPKLWIPKKDDIYYLEEIPLLGSGKLDLKELNRIAREKVEEVETELV